VRRGAAGPREERRLPDLAFDGMIVRAVRYAPGAAQRPHEHETGALTLVYRGRLSERVGGHEEAAGPLSIVVKPPAVRHANRFGPEGAWVLQILFTQGLLDSWASEWRMGGWRWSHGGDAVRPFLAILESLRRRPPDAAHVESLIFELLARLEPEEAGRAATQAPPWLAAARERIIEGFDDRVRVRELAGDAGVHPVSLARAFRRHYGIPITAMTRRRRVAAAAARLSDGEQALCDVAVVAGFSDQAHFCRVFKGSTGLTPLRFRCLTRP
jgi:AraC family transcriptional regulator